jgi:hypothetical protein
LSINILGIIPVAGSPTAPQEKISVPVVQEAGIAAAAAATDPVIELLKQLLPVDNPIGTLLEKFRQAATLSNPQTTDEHSFAEIIELLRNLPVDLKNVTGDQLRTVIDRLGLRYEPMLQAAFTQQTPVTAPQLTAQNLKAALLQFLATQAPPNAVTPGALGTSPGTSTPETAFQRQVLDTLRKLAQENLESILVKQLEVQSRTVTTADIEQAPSRPGRTAPAHLEPSQPTELLRNILTILEGHDAPQLKSALMQVLKTSFTDKDKSASADPSQEGFSDGEPPLTLNALKQALSKLSPSGIQDLMEQVLAHSEPTLKASLTETVNAAPVRNDKPGSVVPQESETTEQPLTAEGKQTVGRSDQSRVRQTAEQVSAQAVTKVPLGSPDTISRSPALPVSPGSVAGTVREQAHELLTAIERTQVLNSINGERGQPVTFQIPIVLDSQTSTAQFYIEGRPDEARTIAPEERHYTVVALLDLSGLGQLRIDLALHRKNLSVKVTVERTDVETFANQLLPDLGQGLKDRGFALEFLKCERKMEGSTGATELRDRTLPKNVVNLRI